MRNSLRYLLLVLYIIMSPILAQSDSSQKIRDPFTTASANLAAIQKGAGDKINLNFRQIETRELLQLLAQYKGINIIMSDVVKGNMSLHLQNVSWEQAVDTVLMMKGLVKFQQNGVLFIMPAGEIKLHQQADLQTQPLTSALISLHYAKAEDIKNMLLNKNQDLLSERGAVGADIRTNSIWVKDTPDKLTTIRMFISKLDIATQQVMITARIVNVDENFVRDLGVRFGTTAIHDLSVDGLSMDMPAPVLQPGQFTVAIARLADNTLLDLELSALESEGHAKIISNPRLITTNRQTAVIESGQEIPYQEKTLGGATNVAFKKAVLSLKVTPEITPFGKIVLNLIVNQDKISSIFVHGVPAIQTQDVQTQVLVNNNQTIVLGGIYEQSERNVVERIPFLGDIPLLGGLFRHKKIQSERKELLIFVTPTIVDAL